MLRADGRARHGAVLPGREGACCRSPTRTSSPTSTSGRATASPRPGYRQYEISNWALPGRECRHNLVYWHADPYLGFGAGAHSFFAGKRFANVDAPNRYSDAVNESFEERQATGRGTMRQIAGGESPDEATLRADAMILGLRLMEGVSPQTSPRASASRPSRPFGPAIERHLALGLLEDVPGDLDRLRLTERGQLLSNEVFVDLLPDPEG